MATVMLAHETDPNEARACGIGRTREIAKSRAIDMWLERVCNVRNPTNDDRNAVECDLESGAILEMAFG